MTLNVWVHDPSPTPRKSLLSPLSSQRARNPLLRQGAWRTGSQITWHGLEPGAEPDWGEGGRFVAFSLPDPLPGRPGGGLYAAFNAGHLPVAATLPHWPGRLWQPALDSSKAAPFDVNVVDDVLSQPEVDALRDAWKPWQRAGVLPLLPYSCAVCVSVPDPESD